MYGISARRSGTAVIFGIYMIRMQRLSSIGSREFADAADAGPAELVRDGECPPAALTQVAVLCQDAGTRPVVDIVDGVAAGQLLVDAVTLIVIVIDISILLDHIVSFLQFVIAMVGCDILGESWREDIADVAILIIDIVCLSLTALTNQQQWSRLQDGMRGQPDG